MVEGPLRKELDVLHAAITSLRMDLAEHEMYDGISREEADKRLMWYAALERLAAEVGEFFKTGDDTKLRTMHSEIRMLHRYISPAVPRERMPRPA